MARSVAILLAGGAGLRLGTPGNKVYLELEGRPLLAYPLAALEGSAQVDEIVVVVRADEHAAAQRAVAIAGAAKTAAIVPGGADRPGSERAGLDVVRPAIVRGDVDVVAIHDGARPFPSVSLIDLVVETARHVGGAVPGLAVEEPLFTGDVASPRRIERELVRMQTPQAFRARQLLAAYDAAAGDAGFVAADTAETVEHFGRLDIAVVAGEHDNIKVTYPEDLPAARRLARAWQHR